MVARPELRVVRVTPSAFREAKPIFTPSRDRSPELVERNINELEIVEQVDRFIDPSRSSLKRQVEPNPCRRLVTARETEAEVRFGERQQTLFIAAIERRRGDQA